MTWLRKTIVFLVLFGALLAGLVGWYAYWHYTDAEVVRKLALEAIQNAFPKAEVELPTVQTTISGAFRLRDLVLRGKAEDGQPSEWIRLPDVLLVPDKRELLSLKFRLSKIVLREAVLELRREADGRWNLQHWLADQPIEIRHASLLQIREGIVRISCSSASFPCIELADVNADVELRPPDHIIWNGTFGHACATRVHIAGEADLAERNTRIDAYTGEPIDLSNLRRQLPHLEAHARACTQ